MMLSAMKKKEKPYTTHGTDAYWH